ncbi:MAG TPA: GxxExxY protein [Acetobacteraceae bacterium]|jgi:GxxExxY protein
MAATWCGLAVASCGNHVAARVASGARRMLQRSEHAAGLLVRGTVVVEPKAVKALDRGHTAQSINYLKATGLGLCLLLTHQPASWATPPTVS